MRILRRMARIQVYLPDNLHAEVKARGLPASELLQNAVRAELRRLELLDETDRYLEELVAEVGEPSSKHRKDAEALVGRLKTRASSRRAG
jgi:post-segregation antitoxin (ccd killing protein)